MEGADQEQPQQKHACRVCRRIFPCGRSLGGHMRSHVPTGSPSEAAKGKPAPQQLRQKGSATSPSNTSTGLSVSAAGYGLRKNPRKTWRAHESIPAGVCTEEAKLCRECGKGFPSWQALFGHMRRHPARQQKQERAQDAGDEQREEEEEVVVVVGEEDGEVQDAEAGGSWDGGTVGVALCLMMLSRDARFCVPSDESSALPGKMEGISGSGESTGTRGWVWQLGENSPSKKRKVSVLDAGVARSRGKGCQGGSRGAPHRKNKFECGACGKAFHSYQALGGHCAGHRRRHFAVSSDAREIRGAEHGRQPVHPPPGALDLNILAVAGDDSVMAGEKPV